MGIDMANAELIDHTALALHDLLEKGEITPLDCLDALEARIARVDPHVNALPTLCFDRARDHAKRLMSKPFAERGVLSGIPVAIKDLTNVAGVRSTQGSPIFENHIPDASDLMVEHIEDEGGIIYAKSNTPEFGAGANTFNPVFGATRNPYNTALSAAGSSGGSAVALATGMAWLAQGSDLGGSLRNPASFNNIVGLRPTPGRVAFTRGGRFDSSLSVEGPMARTVEDLAFFLDAMSGDDPRDPMSKPRPIRSFLSAARGKTQPLRVAYSEDLGITPVDREVRRITREAAEQFQKAGVRVDDAHPDVGDAYAIFQTLRAQSYAIGMRDLMRDHRDALKPEVIWNTEKGLALSMADVVHAELARTALMQRVANFFEHYDVLLCPATIVPPFPVEERAVMSCEGKGFETYVDWLLIVAVATLAGCPALSLPCGFTKDGLPVGLQMIGPANGEAKLLSAAHQLEMILDLKTGKPILPRVTHATS
jgi:amidase